MELTVVEGVVSNTVQVMSGEVIIVEERILKTHLSLKL
jgi:hypothetical protein